MVFNLVPVIDTVFKAPLTTSKVELKVNNLLEFKAPVEAETPKPKYREVKAIITFYTAAADECGKSNGITASGKKVSRGMVAGPRHLAFGTKVEIDGEIYTVEDRGGAIKVKNGVYYFDVYVPTKAEAFKRGRQNKTVKIYDGI